MRWRCDSWAGSFAWAAIVSIALSKTAYGQADPTTQYSIPADANAALLYQKAAELIRAESPANSTAIFPNYFPLPSEWKRMESIAWEQNSNARLLAHLARPLQHAQWTAVSQLNGMRAIANDLGDAALYADSKGDEAQAIDLILDVLHEAELLRNSSTDELKSLALQYGLDFPLVFGPGAILWPDLATQWSKTVHPGLIHGLVGSNS